MKEKLKNRCLTDREIALFIDKRAGSREYERAVAHLSSCGECLDKTIEVKRFLQAETAAMPRDLAEKAFRKSALEIGKSMFRKSRRRLAAASIAVAASLFVVILAGVYNRIDLQNLNKETITSNLLQNKKASESRLTQYVGKDIKYAAGTKKVLSSVHALKVVIKKQELMNKPLMYAGYLYFLVVNSEEPDSQLIDKLLSVIGQTKLNQKNSAVLLNQGWYELFLKEVSTLPKKDLLDFSEGYIMSSLYHSDTNGKVSRATLEWGARLANIASMDEISDRMLYQRGEY